MLGIFIMTCMFISTTPLFYPIQFPSSNIHAIKGYGDFNAAAEFHGGLDFPIPEGEFTRVPYPGSVNYVINSYIPPNHLDCVLQLSTDPTKNAGWALEHLDLDIDSLYLNTEFQDSVAPCIPHSLSRHVHLAWLDEDAFSSPPAQQGYVNPFDYLPVPTGYDEAMFGYIFHVASPADKKGVWFLRESDQSSSPTPDFQTCIFGIVDAVISPFSAANGVASRDSCGVRSLSYRIARQDPYTTGDSYAPISSFSWRTLFEMSEYLPDDGDMAQNMAEFLAIYWCTPSQDHYTHDVVATNCGLDSIGNNCLDNVWPDDYDRASDWADGELCRGAWDTRLGTSSIYQTAQHHTYARFFDGRYAIQAKAISQGSLDSETRFLPAVDVLQPETEANIKGVVVDNYMPYVEEVIVYQMPDFRILYSSEWEMNSPNSPGSGMSFEADPYFYFPIGQNHIGVAVKYSEVMNTTPYDIKLKTESGGEITWECSAYFRPESWNPQLESQPSYQEDQGAFWQCYEARGTVPGVYAGRIQVCINALSGATDLAGHHIDSNPGTVVAPRDEISGDWILTNYDTDIYDLSNMWGTAHSFRKVTNIKYAGRCFDHCVQVDLPANLRTASLVGDCNYICGFWMRQNVYYTLPDRAYAIAVNGATEAVAMFLVPMKYNYLSSEAPGSGDPPCSWVDNEFRLGEFLWLSVNDVNYFPTGTSLGSSVGSVVCVHSVDGVVFDEEVTNNNWFPAASTIFNGSHVMNIGAASDTSVMVTFYNATGISSGYIDSIEIDEPTVLDIASLCDDDTEISSETICLGLDSGTNPDASHFFKILNRNTYSA